MPKPARDTRARILEAAFRLFYRQGFERSGVDAVAEAAGVTKRTLYNHFPSKDDLIAAVLEAQADLAVAEIGRWCPETVATPDELVAAVFDGLRRWSRAPEWRGSGFTRAAMELAWAPGHPARRAAARQKTAVEEALRDVLLRSGIDRAVPLAQRISLLIEGANTLCLIHGDHGWFDAAEEAARAMARQD